MWLTDTLNDFLVTRTERKSKLQLVRALESEVQSKRVDPRYGRYGRYGRSDIERVERVLAELKARALRA